MADTSETTQSSPETTQQNTSREDIINNFNQSIGLTSNGDSGYEPVPKAIDIYNKVVGNPITGSNPGLNINRGANDLAQLNNNLQDINSYQDNLKSLVNNKSYQSDVYQQMRPFSYNGDYDGAKFERYYNSKPYKELGFSPYRDNESLYNNNMTTGDEFVRAAGQFGNLFMSSISYKNPFKPDLEGAEEMQRYTSIGNAAKPGVSSFLINTALSSAYTFGMGAQMLAETLAIAGITAATGGLDSAITLPLWMTRMAGGASKIAKGAELAGELKNMSKIGQFKSFWDSNRYGKALGVIGKTLNPLENTWEVGKDIAQGTNALKYANQAGTINRFAQFSKNFGEFAKDMVMIKAGAYEAQLEAGMVQIDVTKDLVAKYKENNNGVEPTGTALTEIENLAKEEANRTAFWNLPAIMWSNKFMYETMFAPFEKTAKKGMSNLADDLLFSQKKGFTAVKAGISGKLQKLGAGIQTAEGWGKFGYNYLKMNAPEGVQENIQEAISSGAKAHALARYNNPDRGAYEGYMSHFIKGAKLQFSNQGIETFAGGFVMGSMAQPFMALPIWVGESVWNNTVNKGKYQEYQAQRKAQLAESEKTLNEFYKDPGKYFAPDMINALVQGHLQKEFYNANLNNDRKRAEDIKSLSKFEHLYTALSTGKFDILMDKLKTFKEFSPKDAAEAFNVTDGVKALTMLDDVVKRGERLKTTYQDVSSSYPNPFDPLSYKKDTEEYDAQQNAHIAWEEAKKQLIFAKTEFQNHSDRIQGIAETLISKRNPIKDVNAQDLMTLLDRQQIKAVRNSLMLDIKNTISSTPEGKKVIAEKTKRLELLTALGSDFDTFSEVQDPMLGLNAHIKKVTSKNIKKNFTDYINHIAGTTGNIAFDDELDHALDLIRDNYNLRDERSSLVRSINVLNNPKGFLNLYRNIAEVNTEIEKNKKDYIKAHLGEFSNNKEINNAINELYKTAGVFLTKEYRDYLKEALDNNQVIEPPKSYIDGLSANFNIIDNELDPRFIKAKEEWLKIIKSIQAENPVNKVPVKPVTTSTIVPGQLIYASTGSGKSKYVKDNPTENFVDADVLLIEEIKKSVPEFKIIPETEDNVTLLQFASQVPKEVRNKVYTAVREQIEVLKSKGQSVLTGSTAFIEDMKDSKGNIIKGADLIYVQTNNKLLKDKGLSNEDIKKLKERELTAIGAKSYMTINNYIGYKLKLPQTREEIEKEKDDALAKIRIDIFKLPTQTIFFNENGDDYAVVTKGTTLKDTIVGKPPFGEDFPASNIQGDVYNTDPTSIFDKYNKKIDALNKEEEGLAKAKVKKSKAKKEKTSTATVSTDAKADIERRRQEIRTAIRKAVNPQLTLIDNSIVNGRVETIVGNTIQTDKGEIDFDLIKKVIAPEEVKEYGTNKILAKKGEVLYDAELAALEIEEPGIKTGSYPSDTLIKRGIKLGFTKEQIVDMSTVEREQIAQALSSDDVVDLLSKYITEPIISTIPYTIGKEDKYGNSKLTFSEAITGPTDPAFPEEFYTLSKEDDKWVVRNLEISNAIIGSSKISKEDAIENTMAQLLKMNEILEKSNIRAIIKDINKVKTFQGLSDLEDNVTENSSLKTNYIMDGLIQEAFTKRKEELFKVINRKNLEFAKSRGWNIRIGDEIYSTFTIDPGKTNPVKINTGSNIPLAEYSISDVDEITKDKPTEPKMTPETKAEIQEVVKEGAKILSTETIKQSFDEVSAQADTDIVKTKKDVTKDFTNNLGCK